MPFYSSRSSFWKVYLLHHWKSKFWIWKLTLLLLCLFLICFKISSLSSTISVNHKNVFYYISSCASTYTRYRIIFLKLQLKTISVTLLFQSLQILPLPTAYPVLQKNVSQASNTAFPLEQPTPSFTSPRHIFFLFFLSFLRQDLT